MEKSFEEFKKILICGSADEILEAKNEIDRLWRRDKTWFKRSKRAYFLMLENLSETGDEKTQARLIASFNLFVLAFGEEKFDYLSDYFLEKMQSNNGYLRRAALRSFSWLGMHFLKKSNQSFVKKSCDWNTFKEEKEKARLEYNFLLDKIAALIKKYEKKLDRKNAAGAKNKAIRKILTLALERVSGYRHEFSKSSWKRDELMFKQKKLDEKIKEIILRKKLKISSDNIFNLVYIEKGNALKSFHRFLDAILSKVPKSEELTSEEIEIISEAWNYFPHESLNGKCPAQIIQESVDKQLNKAAKPRPPLWQKMEDVPNVSLSLEDGKLVLGGAEENNFFDDKTLIGTGAGGKDGKLRFYFIFAAANNADFSESMALRFGLAAKDTADQHDCDLEKIEIEDNYALVAILIPYDAAPGVFGDGMRKTIGRGKARIIKNHYYSDNVSKPERGGIKKYLDYLKSKNIE